MTPTERSFEGHDPAVPSVVDVAVDRRLDLIRGEISIQIGIAMMLLELAATYVYCGFDDHLDDAMTGARDRMRAALSLTAKLMGERRDSDINGDAAAEWRSQAESRRRA